MLDAVLDNQWDGGPGVLLGGAIQSLYDTIVEY